MKNAPLIGLLLAIWTAGSALAQGEIVAPVPCSTPEDLLASPTALARVGERVSEAAPLTIVAFGSSSTFGTGASSPGASYPSQLEEILRESLPRSEIRVENKGIPGERSQQMLARLARDALDLKPDLLIWQMGTNSALTRADVNEFGKDVERGIEIVRASGIDLLLLTPQYAPAFLAAPDHDSYLAKIATIARDRHVAVFRRFEAMRYWQEVNRLPAENLTGPDGLHMTDLGYSCLARAVARMIVKLARQPEPRHVEPRAVAMPLNPRP